jgi:histidine triad (HIT) family protein
MAFMDVNPANPGHTLVVPKRHVRDVYELDDDVAASIMRTTMRVARAVKSALQPDGVTLLQTNEQAGGQSVFHLHFHVIPRWHGDGLVGPRRPRRGDPTAIEEMAAKIREQLKAATSA